MQHVLERIEEQLRAGLISRRKFVALSAMATAQAAMPAFAQGTSMPFPVITLNHVSIPVANPPKTLEFYQKIFDFSIFTSQSNGKVPAMTISGGPQSVMLADSNIYPRERLKHHSCLGMRNFDPNVVVKTLNANGIEASARPRPAAASVPPGTIDTPELGFRDPDGLALQIQAADYCGGTGFLGNECKFDPAKRTKSLLVVRTLNSVQHYVSNVDRSLAFYLKVFDVKVRTRQAKGAVPILTIGDGPHFISLHEGDSIGHHFTLGIENFDAQQALKVLKSQGVAAELRMRPAAEQRPIVEGAKDTPEIKFLDPDGIGVTLVDWRNAGGVGPIGSIVA